MVGGVGLGGERDWKIYKYFTLKTLNEQNCLVDLDVILNAFYGKRLDFMDRIHVYRNRVEQWWTESW